MGREALRVHDGDDGRENGEGGECEEGRGAAQRARARHDGTILAQRRRRLLCVLVVLLLAPAFLTSARGLFPYVRYALSVAAEPMEKRREMVWGGWARELRTIPANASVDVVMANAQSRDTAVFVAAALAPRTVFLFDDLEGWRRFEPAKLYLDPDALNAAVRPKKHAGIVLLVDGE